MASAKGRRKYSKASRAASAKLKGVEVTPESDIVLPAGEGRPEKGQRWLDRPVMKGMRLTWKAVVMFLLFCLLLDIMLYLLVQVGLGRCYGLLCLIG